MRKFAKPLLYLLIFIGLSNVVPLYHVFRFVGDGVLVQPLESDYITKDNVFVYSGWLKDTLKNPYYKRYILLYPQADRTLYRVRSIEIWRFWRWRDYLTEERWWQPYLKTDLDSIHYKSTSFVKIYNPYYGSIPPRTYNDSLSARNHLYTSED
jgi:hypothetical protein